MAGEEVSTKMSSFYSCLEELRLVGLFGSVGMILFLKQKNCFSCAGYLFGYPLATYLGYPTEAGFAG